MSPRDVARLLGLGVNTFYRRVKRWGWKRRRLRVEELDAMAQDIAASDAALADEELAAFAARVAEDRRSSAERARDVVMAQFAAIEASQKRILKAAVSAIEGERSARTLLALARALAQIEALEREEAERRERRAQASRSGAGRADATWGARGDGRFEDEAEDVEAMRMDLAKKLEGFRAQWDEEQRQAGRADGR